MTPNEIQNKTFEKKMGGYRIEEVTAFLSEVAAYVQDLMDDKEQLENKMMVLAEKVEEYREDEDSLRAALIGAQKLGDSVVRDAKKKAEMILAEASRKAEDLVNDAQSNIDREAIALSRMQMQVAEFKNQILNMYKKHMDIISTIPEEAAMPSDVRRIVDGVAHMVSDQRAAEQEKEDKLDTFTVTFEDSETEDEERAAQKDDDRKDKHGHKRDFGNLRFGEEYNLTRKE